MLICWQPLAVSHHCTLPHVIRCAALPPVLQFEALLFLPSFRDAADLVVQGKGKFEELMVCSHEIAASTAQLVAASKVILLNRTLLLLPAAGYNREGVPSNASSQINIKK